MSGYRREDYDDRIMAEQLQEGDEIHLLFMGGDEYCIVTGVKRSDMGQVTWTADTTVNEISDTVPASHMVWIRKRPAARTNQPKED